MEGFEDTVSNDYKGNKLLAIFFSVTNVDSISVYNLCNREIYLDLMRERVVLMRIGRVVY